MGKRYFGTSLSFFLALTGGALAEAPIRQRPIVPPVQIPSRVPQTRPVETLPQVEGKTTTAKVVLTDAAIVAAIIAASIAAYRAGGPGPCACPSDVDRGGHSCGRRSAHDRAGGWTVYCSVADVSKEMIDAYRRAKGN